MTNYWTEDHDKAIRDYFHSSTVEARYKIIDHVLAKPLYELAKRSLAQLCVAPDFEYQQDIVIHLIYKSMPKLTEDKLQGALQYLWTSARNYILTYIRTSNDHKLLSVDEVIEYTVNTEAFHRDYYQDSQAMGEVNLELTHERDAIRRRIMKEIDLRIKGQHIVNTTNSVYLLLLRQYIIDHEYDVRGFGAYIMQAMHLKLATYRAVTARIGLRTMQFNEEIQELAESELLYAKRVIGIKDGKAMIYEGIREAGRQTGSYYQNISLCCQGKNRLKSTNGISWFYLNDQTKWLQELRKQQSGGVIAKSTKIKK